CASVTSNSLRLSRMRALDSTGGSAAAWSSAGAAAGAVSATAMMGALRWSYSNDFNVCLSLAYCAGANSTTFKVNWREQFKVPSLAVTFSLQLRHGSSIAGYDGRETVWPRP